MDEEGVIATPPLEEIEKMTLFFTPGWGDRKKIGEIPQITYVLCGNIIFLVENVDTAMQQIYSSPRIRTDTKQLESENFQIFLTFTKHFISWVNKASFF